MTYGAQDAFRDINEGASNTARTIKSEFNNAFLSFANGTETASDAFTKMALNVSDKIQQLALEFSTNLIFGKLFGSTSGIGGGIGDFLSGLSKSKGGMIKGYSSGGNVTGGSGNKDDVPAMLSGGEYVIRKSAVNKYGTGLMGMINGGAIPKFADGGFFAKMASVVPPAILGSKSTSPSPTYGTGMGGMKNDRQDNYFKYGGRVQKFAGGGEAQFLGENVYRYNDPLYPTAGENVIDSRLSLQAILDPNNPQNRIRQEREQRLYDYLNYVEGVRLENERALQENIALNKKIQDQYNSQKNAKSKGAYYQALFGLAGVGLSFVGSSGGFGAGQKTSNQVGLRSPYVSPSLGTSPAPNASARLKVGKAMGGYIRGFANGGSSGKDDIPALLMGGEFVMRKEAVNMYGKKFFDDLNSGRAKKFADGGQVGSIDGASSNNYSPTNNVSVVVNLNQQATPNENTNENASNANDEKRAEAQRTKDLAEKVKTQVIRVITEQQRPGGLLSSAIYKKQQ